MNNKKVAIILTGHMRTYLKTYKSIINNLLIPNNADLFIITYDIIDNFKLGVGEKRNEIKIDVADINKKFNPYLKVLKIIDSHNFYFEYDRINDFNYKAPERLDRLLTMLKNIYEGYHVIIKYQKENNITYDFIIRTRIDILLKQQIDIDNYKPSPNSIIVPTPDTGMNINGMTLNDHIVIGDSPSMLIYLMYSEHMRDVNNYIDVSCVEPGICYYLVKNGINIDKRFINYNIIRTIDQIEAKKKRMKYYKHLSRKT